MIVEAVEEDPRWYEEYVPHRRHRKRGSSGNDGHGPRQ